MLQELSDFQEVELPRRFRKESACVTTDDF